MWGEYLCRHCYPSHGLALFLKIHLRLFSPIHIVLHLISSDLLFVLLTPSLRNISFSYPHYLDFQQFSYESCRRKGNAKFISWFHGRPNVASPICLLVPIMTCVNPPGICSICLDNSSQHMHSANYVVQTQKLPRSAVIINWNSRSLVHVGYIRSSLLQPGEDFATTRLSGVT